MRGQLKRTMRRKWICIALCACLFCAGAAGCGAEEKDNMADKNASCATQDEVPEANAKETTEADVKETIGTSETLENPDSESETDETEMTDVSEKSEETASETAEENSAPLQGLSLSILGDSLSTYEGWIPGECTNFFPMNGKLTDVSETWWMQVLAQTGMELCSNNSSAGCTCAGDSLYTGEVKYGCSTDRISLLTGSQGKMPDVIIVFMGTNDLLKGVPLGDNDGTGLVEEGEIDNFSDAYTLILDKLASEYPMAQVYCCGLHPVGDWGTKQPFVLLNNYDGLTAEDFSKRIELIAGNKGVPYIDLYHCGIEVDNLQQMTSDGVHYTPLGMSYVAKAVIDCLNASGN